MTQASSIMLLIEIITSVPVKRYKANERTFTYTQWNMTYINNGDEKKRK